MTTRGRHVEKCCYSVEMATPLSKQRRDEENKRPGVVMEGTCVTIHRGDTSPSKLKFPNLGLPQPIRTLRKTSRGPAQGTQWSGIPSPDRPRARQILLTNRSFLVNEARYHCTSPASALCMQSTLKVQEKSRESQWVGGMALLQWG